MRNAGFFLIFVLVANLATGQANTNPEYSLGKEGLEYKIISTGEGATVKQGNFMQLHFASYYNNGSIDSVLNDSRKTGTPVTENFDSATVPTAYYYIIKQVRAGDSVAIRMLTDSAFKAEQGQMPPFFQKGRYLITTLKILNIFTSAKEADSARAASMAEAARKDSTNAIAQYAKEETLLNEYFQKNNVQPVKAPKGTYIQLVKKGIGKNATVKDKVKVNYTGRTFSGKVFDSNTDSTFGHVEPLEVDLSKARKVIPGWEEGLLYLNQGCKAVLFIPSSLGYGPHGYDAAIGPNEILIFDIEIVSINPVNDIIKPAPQKRKPAAASNTKKKGK